MDYHNENRKKEDGRAENSGEEKDEIEEGNYLQEDQREDARELHGANDREQMQQGSVIAEPENGINEDRERRRDQCGNSAWIGCLRDGAKRVLCYHWPSSQLVAIIPKMKTTAAKTPMIAEYLSAAMWSLNTMDARRPSFT